MRSARAFAGRLLAIAFVAHAGQYPVRTLTTSQGLPSNSINNIFQDSRGFIWIATAGGIARFDGRQVQVYAPEGEEAGDSARNFFESRDGDVWAAGNRGLVRFQGPDMGRAVRIAGPRDGQGGSALYAILEDQEDGFFWVGGPAGLFRFHALGNGASSSFQPVKFTSPGASTTVFALCRDRRGALWIGTSDGIYRRGGDSKSRRIASARAVGSVIEDRAGYIWASSFDRGLLRIDATGTPGDFPVVHTCAQSNGLPTHHVFVVTETSDGRLLTGAHLGVAERLASTAPDVPCAFRTPPDFQFPAADVRALHQDREGNVWVGTETGVHQVATAGFMSHSRADGLAASTVESIFESRGNLFAVSGHVSVSRFDGRRFDPVTFNVTGAMKWPESGWATGQSILRDYAGEWWVPTAIGLYRFRNVDRLADLRSIKPRIYRKRDGLPSDHVFRLFEDSHGTLWISAIYGPDFLVSMGPRRDRFLRHRVPPDTDVLPQGPPTAFRQTPSGALWVGFWRGAIARLKDGQWSYYRPSDGAPGGFVYEILCARNGDVWVGSSAGLTRIGSPDASKPEFVTYTRNHGLASTGVTCLVEDLAGRLYVCTTKGVDRIDPENFPGPIRRYSSLDGLPPTWLHAAYRDRAGRLWFAGAFEGLASFWPEEEKPQTVNPVVLTSVRIRGVGYGPVLWNGLHGIRLPASRNDLEFEFVTPSLRGLPVRYRHKLAGSDDQWSDPTEGGTIHFVGLPAGRYQLLVESMTGQGASGSRTLATFEILPPVWRRWWALILTAAAIASLIFAAHRYQLRRVLELERVRMRIATDLHDELGADLSRLAVLSETAQLDGRRDETLPRIASLARTMLDATADVVWAIRPQKDRLSDLAQRMREFANDLFAGDGMRVSFLTPDRDVRLNPTSGDRSSRFSRNVSIMSLAIPAPPQWRSNSALRNTRSSCAFPTTVEGFTRTKPVRPRSAMA